MPFRLSAAPASLLRPATPIHITAARSLASARHASSVPKPSVKTDQTKESNSPDEDVRPEHHEAGTVAKSLEGNKADRQSHPAKQPDPQQSPAKSTGIQAHGPGSAAGEGREPALEKENLEGGRSKEHSVYKPDSHKGNTVGGRGGDAL